MEDEDESLIRQTYVKTIKSITNENRERRKLKGK